MKRTMRVQRAIFVILGFFALLAPSSWAAKSDAGTSGAKFLRIGPGARPTAMGEAFSTVAGDLHNVYYNPAGLSSLKGSVIGGMHNQYFQGFGYDFMGYAAPVIKGRSGFGVSVYNLSVDGIERRTNDTDSDLGTFSATDFAYGLSYGHKVIDRLSLGANFKYVNQTLDTEKATAMSFDVGSRFEVPNRPVVLALGARHLGTQPKFRDVASPLPSIYYGGASIFLLDLLTVAAEVGMPRDQETLVSFGTEYNKMLPGDFAFAVRGGYNTANTDPGGLAGASFGAGMSYRRLTIDFAWVPFGDLGDTFRYSLQLKF
ncbi:MAG: PorV/PorQ family protein [Elusimicrobiota bacterium]